MALARLMMEDYLDREDTNPEEFDRLYQAVRHTTQIYARLVRQSIQQKHAALTADFPKSHDATSSQDSRDGKLPRLDQALQLERDLSFQELQEAFEDMRSVARHDPGIGKDGALLIQQSSARCESALRRYRDALQRYHEFIKSRFSPPP